MESEKKPLILVAEDDKSNFLIDNYYLRKKYEVAHAVDGLDVIEKCEQLKPDLILMDIHMPNLNGIEAMRRIKEKHPDLPIIALTAFAYDGEDQTYIGYGFDCFIVKPIKIESFYKSLESLLKR